jgi:hypothetical protein
LHCWSHAAFGVAAVVIVSAREGNFFKKSRVWWKVTKHNRSMSLRKSGHREGVGNPSTPAEEDVKVYIYIYNKNLFFEACL